MAAPASSTAMAWDRPGTWLRLVGLAATYFVLAEIGLEFALPGFLASPVWPPTGLAIAAVAVWGRRAGWGVLAGAFVAEYVAAENLWASLGMGLGNTIEALVGGLLLAHLGGAAAFSRLVGVVRFLGIALLAPVASATLGVGSLVAVGIIPEAAAPNSWWTWYLGDAAGALVITPLLVQLFGAPRQPLVRRDLAAGLTAIPLLLAVAALLFGLVPGVAHAHPSLLVLLMPPLVWVGFRLGPCPAALGILLLDILAIQVTRMGLGPFVHADANTSFLLLQTFVFTVGLLVLGLAALAEERRHAIADAKRHAVDEARRQSEQANAEVRHLREQTEFKTNFLRTAAHELATPMTPILLQLRVLRDLADKRPQAPEGRATAILQRNVDRLQALVHDLLDSARLQSNRLRLNVSPVDLGRIVHDVLESYQGPATASGVTLRSEPTGDLHLAADPHRLAQVFDNLLSNALKFTPSGGAVVVRLRGLADAVEVAVSDTGCGFTAQQAPRLFQPFSQLHDPMESMTQGSGLGLYICKGIVEQHGGRIEGESDGPGRGATFTVTLPRVASPPAAPS